MMATDRSQGRNTAKLATLLVALWAVTAGAFAFSTPVRTGWVTDEAGILDAESAAAIASRLEDLQRKTGKEVVVVTLADLQGASIETWGNVLGESWRVGRGGGTDSGALLIVAPNDRKVRIAVGYGLGNRISDAVAAMIIDDHILPYFRQGNFARGVKAGVDSIILQLEPQGGSAANSDVERAGPVVVFQRPSFWQWLKYKLTPSRQTKVIAIWIVVIIVVLVVMTFAGNSGWGRSRRYDDDYFSSSNDSDSGWSSGGGGGSSNSGSSGGSYGGGATGSW